MIRIAENFVKIQAELAKVCHSCGRDPSGITLIAVTKNRSVGEINRVIEAGVSVIGENRVQEALQKFPELLTSERHLIGHLQTNKIREVVANFDCVQSVDSVRLAEKISQECERVSKILPIYLQVNIAGEETKSGFAVVELAESVKKIQKLPNLKLVGLMAIGAHTADQAQVAQVFRKGKELTDQFGLPNYSAGMSADWPLAVRAGATHLRLGRILFE